MGRVDEGEWLSANKIARRFDISPRTLRRWTAEGRLPAIKTPGGHRRYRISDVLALLTDVEYGPERIETHQNASPSEHPYD